jgi:hypothetical protein
MAAKKKPCLPGKTRRKTKSGKRVCLPKKKAGAKKPRLKRDAAVRGRFHFQDDTRPKGAKGWQARKPCKGFDWVSSPGGTMTIADLDTNTCKPLPCNLKAAVAKAKSLKKAQDYFTSETQRVLRPCHAVGKMRLHPGATKATQKAIKNAISPALRKKIYAMGTSSD